MANGVIQMCLWFSSTHAVHILAQISESVDEALDSALILEMDRRRSDGVSACAEKPGTLSPRSILPTDDVLLLLPFGVCGGVVPDLFISIFFARIATDSESIHRSW